MELAVTHRHRHHVVELHLGHHGSQKLFRSIHDFEEIDARLQTQILEDRHGHFGGNIARAPSQAIERRINEGGAATNRFHAVRNGKLQVAVPMETKLALGNVRGQR